MHRDYASEQTNDFHLQIFIWVATEATFQPSVNTPQAEYTKLFHPSCYFDGSTRYVYDVNHSNTGHKMHLNKPILLTPVDNCYDSVYLPSFTIGDQATVVINRINRSILSSNRGRPSCDAASE